MEIVFACINDRNSYFRYNVSVVFVNFVIRNVRCICMVGDIAASIKPKLIDGFISSIQYTQYVASNDLCICISPLPCSVTGAHSSDVSAVVVISVLDFVVGVVAVAVVGTLLCIVCAA